MTKVVKRNGEIVNYDGDKIINAVSKAMTEVEGFVDRDFAVEIEKNIYKKIKGIHGEVTVEDIQDLVEIHLMSQYPNIAKAYILYRDRRNKERNKCWEMTELQQDIYENKYRYNNESFEEFLNRVSGGNNQVAELIKAQDFLYAGRILAGRGLDRNVTLSNCYVLPSPEDNIESIFDTAKYMARTYSYGGGVGTDLSNLRPAGAKVNNAALTTSGAVSFMDLYDVTTAVIGQKGRRGALMLSMSTDHPDIDAFIDSKKDINKITHANISIRTNDKFFNNLDKNGNILRKLAQNNWESAEPGILFWDRVEDWHLLSEHPEYELYSTNPCGEQPLPGGGSCLLGSINLSNFVLNPFTDNATIDYKRLEDVVKIVIVGMNEVLDDGIPLHPLKIQRDIATNFRQIGTGIMGLGDLFIKMGVKYGSEESLEISNKLGSLIRDTAILQSIELAKKQGAYPAFNISHIMKSNYFKSLPKHLQNEIEKYGMRNSHVLSIAPTGSISTMTGVSGGIEPIFANSFMRTTKSLSGQGDVKYKVYTKVISDLMEAKGIKDEKDLPEYCVTSHDILPINRIRLQAVWQKYVDSAISSTINLHEKTTVEEIEDIYIQAWKHGLKGVTVYRDNCFRTGILEVEDDEPSKFECPECGHDLSMSEGCNSCPECGWGQCSI